MDILSLSQPQIVSVSREVRFCSHSSGRYSSSFKFERKRDFNLERLEKGEEEEGIVSLPGATAGIRDIIGQSSYINSERQGNDGNNGK
jgi:hypothetical protein